MMAGLTPEECARIANLAGNICVQHQGTYSVTLKDLMTIDKPKILSIEDLETIKTETNKVVFVNGCFDVLHPGHVELLKFAKSKGDILIVGLNSDASVKALKGEQRPIINESDRAKMLTALECVDGVYIFSETTPHNTIKLLRPDIHVKGNDHKNQTEGVPVTLFFDRFGGYSTTNIISN
jgi:rfaE bifunctional protein nucleotidyltransferase chain/domain